MAIIDHLIMRLKTKNNDLRMKAASLYVMKDKEENPQGQDAHFICAEKQTIGVFDGVGGWSKKGVDSGEYARELMTNCFLSVLNQSEGKVDPESVLSEAFSQTKAQGSCTACILTLDNNVIHAVNVGDSGFLIIRIGKAVYRSPIQQHRFNCPYQLGRNNDSPSKAEVMKVEVELGDVLVAGTDGLFDNIDVLQIEEIIAQTTKDGKNPEQFAANIANHALHNSFDRYADTPYSRASKKAKRQHSGGKVDDITVVVAFVVRNQN